MSLKDVKLGKYEIVAEPKVIIYHTQTLAKSIEEKYGLDAIVGVVPILTGGLMLGQNFAQAIKNRCLIEPIKISLYKDSRTINRESVKECKFELEPNYNRLSECDVIVIVDDICDTGWTLHLTKEKVSKNLNREVPIVTFTAVNVMNQSPMRVCEPDYWIVNGNPEDWYFGYGMDYKYGLYRELDFIGKVDRFNE